ncbi:CCA tRNA nucleotidyltransferase [Patescibacteria group bacterium]|nr:CCA tRNA nucleotidyltransferase [Patescibacteria group bacterium]
MDFKIPKKVTDLMEKVEKAGGEIYIVGGAVRDLIIGREIYDWDFATNLTPEEMQKAFPKSGFYNNEFGTFRVVSKDKEIFEITTYRSEKGYGDFRHPSEIQWGKTIEEDLSRRDFTVNAMAWRQAQGKPDLVDVFGGQEDIKNKLVRAVRDPEERFQEDALRILKAFRMAAQLGFMIEEKTLLAAEKKAPLLENISAERVRDELFKLLAGDQPAIALTLMKNTGVLQMILPELLEGYGVSQKGHHIYDVWTHSINALQNTDSHDPVTRLAVLLHDVAKPRVMKGEGEARTFHNHEVVGARMAAAVGKRLRLSNKEMDQLFRLVRWHMFSTAESQTDSAVRRFIRHVTPELVNEMLSLRRADRLGSGAKESSWRLEDFKNRVVEVQKQPFSVKDLKIDGHDVMRVLGIKPGPKVGQILNDIFAEVERDPSLNEREVLLQKLESRNI